MEPLGRFELPHDRLRKPALFRLATGARHGELLRSRTIATRSVAHVAPRRRLRIARLAVNARSWVTVDLKLGARPGARTRTQPIKSRTPCRSGSARMVETAGIEPATLPPEGSALSLRHVSMVGVGGLEPPPIRDMNPLPCRWAKPHRCWSRVRDLNSQCASAPLIYNQVPYR